MSAQAALAPQQIVKRTDLSFQVTEDGKDGESDGLLSQSSGDHDAKHDHHPRTKMAYPVLRRRWPWGKRLWWPLLLTELAVLIPLLVLFGIQQPDLFRSKFWRIGYNYGFNSNPNLVIFAMVNGQPLPTVPFVWSRTLTNFNVAISVINLFMLLVKMILLIMHAYFPIFSTVISLIETVLWTVSVYGQIGPDNADPDHPSPVAWQIAKSCAYARPYNMEKTCKTVKATLGITVVMLAVMVFNLGISIWAMWPSPNAALPPDDDEDDDEDLKGSPVEMHNLAVPPTPSHNPFTPRTTAFNKLNQRSTSS